MRTLAGADLLTILATVSVIGLAVHYAVRGTACLLRGIVRLFTYWHHRH